MHTATFGAALLAVLMAGTTVYLFRARERWLSAMFALVTVLAVMFTVEVARGESPTPTPSPEPVKWTPLTAYLIQECHGNYCLQVRHEWRSRSDDPRRHYLFKAATGQLLNGWPAVSYSTTDNYTVVGCWDYDACVYMNVVNGVWDNTHPVKEPPCPVPGIEKPTKEAVGAVGQEENFGIDLGKMKGRQDKHRFICNGKECDRNEAYALVGGGMPDDADALRLTVIGNPAQAEQLRKDLETHPDLKQWQGRVNVQSYASVDDPMVKGRGFKPGVLIQSPDGRRLGAEASYDGPDQLVEGLRNADARRRDPKVQPVDWPPFRDPGKPRPLDGLRDFASLTAWIKEHMGLILVTVVGSLAVRGLVKDKKK